jgi:hypothetical protein
LIGSTTLASLFLMFRALTGREIISFEGKEASRA